jgi:hypothetical protein
MTEVVLNIEAVPEHIFSHITTRQVRYTLEDGVVKIVPITEESTPIDSLEGLFAFGKSTIDDFIKQKREDKEIEDEKYSRF